MKEINIDEQKKIELEILIEIDKICRKYNIKYTLFGGTLIGAVRHKGFIPWDDDIDIAMTRENYNKFIQYFKKENNKKFKLVNSIENKDFYCSFTKIINANTRLIETRNKNLEYLGVYVDIFPLDKISKSNYKLKVLISKLIAIPLYMLAYNNSFYKNKSFYKRLLRKVFSIIPLNVYSGIINKNAQKDNLKKEYKIGSLVGGQGEKDLWQAKIFEKYIELDFEGYKFMAIKEYDSMLKHRFGDYMKLPTKEEQKPHHYIKAFWRT